MIKFLNLFYIFRVCVFADDTRSLQYPTKWSRTRTLHFGEELPSHINSLWRVRITLLLNMHLILSFGGKRGWWCLSNQATFNAPSIEFSGCRIWRETSFTRDRSRIVNQLKIRPVQCEHRVIAQFHAPKQPNSIGNCNAYEIFKYFM